MIRKRNESIKKLLVFRIGQLGDCLVSLPAIWALRRHFKDHRFFLLSDGHDPRRGLVLAKDVFSGTGIFDDFLHYNSCTRGFPTRRIWDKFSLMLKLRRLDFDCLAYLAPSQRSQNQINRDRFFFQMCGITTQVGMNGFPSFSHSKPLNELPREADFLLRRLSQSNVPVPSEGMGRIDLNLSKKEDTYLQVWVDRNRPPQQRTWVAIAPGSKMASKRWPQKNYMEVASILVSKLNVFPIVFGGLEDRPIGDEIIGKCGAGHNFCGEGSIRESARLLKACSLYIGNDTGTMHLAASVGTKCVVVFSARDFPGLWYPYGSGHFIFRTSLPCEGCLLQECIERANECTQRISVEQVANKAIEFLIS